MRSLMTEYAATRFDPAVICDRVSKVRTTRTINETPVTQMAVLRQKDSDAHHGPAVMVLPPSSAVMNPWHSRPRTRFPQHAFPCTNARWHVVPTDSQPASTQLWSPTMGC